MEEVGTVCGSTALVEACKNRDIGMTDLLLRHGARDDECKALRVATQNRDDILTAKLLSIKVSSYDSLQNYFVCLSKLR